MASLFLGVPVKTQSFLSIGPFWRIATFQATGKKQIGIFSRQKPPREPL
jgi:hypothetical protein